MFTDWKIDVKITILHKQICKISLILVKILAEIFNQKLATKVKIHNVVERTQYKFYLVKNRE